MSGVIIGFVLTLIIPIIIKVLECVDKESSHK